MIRMGSQRILDHYSICVSAASIGSEAVLELVTTCVSRVVADRGALEELTINGQAKAKSLAPICANEVGVILQLFVSLGIIDVIISFKLHTGIDEVVSGVGFGFLECARSKRQVSGIAFPASLLIEKGLDIGSQMCLAQADVEKYYNHLRPLNILSWMVPRYAP